MKSATIKASVKTLTIFSLFLIFGCSRPSNSPAGTYFFTASFLGHTYNFTNQFIQRGDNDYGDVCGYVPSDNFGQAGGIHLYLNDSTTKSRVLSKANTTFTFNPANHITPDLVLNTAGFTFYHAISTTDPAYNIQVTDVIFLKTDSSFNIPEDIYAIRGSFKAKMEDPNSGSYAGDATGAFNIQCTTAHQ